MVHLVNSAPDIAALASLPEGLDTRAPGKPPLLMLPLRAEICSSSSTNIILQGSLPTAQPHRLYRASTCCLLRA